MEGEAVGPRVSIGMPVYNGERFLEEALNSILGQEFGDFELIISDNASCDGTEEICRAFAAGDGRVRYHRSKTNRGAAWNYNRAFDLSAGKYFKWAAHDDVCAPALLRRCVNVLDNAPPRVVLCYPKTVLIDDHGNELGGYEDNVDIRWQSPERRLQHVLENLKMCNVVFGLIRADALRRTRLIGNYVSSDTVLLAELSLLGEFWEVPERLFLRRRHAGASCFANRTSQDVAVWFDPANHGRPVMPITRLLVEHLGGIRQSPLGWSGKMQCCRVALAHWLPRWRAIGGEFMGVLKSRLMRAAGGLQGGRR